MMMPTQSFLPIDANATKAGRAHEFNRRQLHCRMVEDCESLWECSPATQRSFRVLIVDENLYGNDALATLVRGWGHQARSTHDHAVSRDMAAVQQPDIVLIDIATINFDSLENAQQLRNDCSPQRCFIIALTDDANEECRRRCQAADIDLLLIKPVDGFVLQTLLLLEGERLNRARTAPSTK